MPDKIVYTPVINKHGEHVVGNPNRGQYFGFRDGEVVKAGQNFESRHPLYTRSVVPMTDAEIEAAKPKPEPSIRLKSLLVIKETVEEMIKEETEGA